MQVRNIGGSERENYYTNGNRGAYGLIKGVNKQVIEINDTGNQYYDHAILFLRPEYADAQREVLEKEAKKLLKKIDTTSTARRKNRFIYWAIRLIPGVLFGAIISILIMRCIIA